MVLKDGAFSWFMNLPEDSISLWGELFIANFKGTYDRALTMNELRRVKQRPDETLRQYIQRFSQVRHKIPRASGEAIITAFTSGVKDIHMCEKLAIDNDLSTTLELFILADKCVGVKIGGSQVGGPEQCV